MKIMIYCQHVLGVGHFFRTLELVKAMSAHEVLLVTGGGRLEVTLPGHVRQVSLPGLMMDTRFKGLHPADPGRSLEEVKKQRRAQLLALVKKQRPELFLVELYPFGRKAFRFELEPVIHYLKTGSDYTCKVVCSIRDILVEKQDRHLHEKRAVQALNHYFDAVLVHSDPRLIRLENSFENTAQIHIPVFYTGFVSARPDPVKTEGFQKKRRYPDEKLIIASAGGGNVGADLLISVAKAFALLLPEKGRFRLHVFTGPYMDKKDKQRLASFKTPGLVVEEFCPDFVSLLAAADLSVSMAGYNTCMNIVAAKVPSLVRPFDQNREQRDRIGRLKSFAPMTLLEDQDLEPARMAACIKTRLMSKKALKGSLDMDGAVTSVKIIEAL